MNVLVSKYKKYLLVLCVLVLTSFFLVKLIASPIRMAINSITSSQRDMKPRRDVFDESLEQLALNAVWHGRPMDFPHPTPESGGMTENLKLVMKALLTGGLNIVGLSKFQMNDYMESWEWNILNRRTLNSTIDAGNGTNSIIALVNGKSTYKVGDVITVRIDVRDGYGNQKKDGGDMLRLWTWTVDGKNRSAQASEVIDMGNGSYISTFPLLNAGKVTIKARMAHNLEIQRTHYFLRNVAKTTRYMAAGFVSEFSSEATLCSTFPVIPDSKEICNFTEQNGGSPWFCGKPRNPALNCRNWKLNSDLVFFSPLPLSEAEKALSNWAEKSKNIPNLTLNVGSPPKISSNISKPRCGSRLLEESWTMEAPRGFMRNKIWHPSTCILNRLSNYDLAGCLRNTTFFLLGDSNLRSAFKLLIHRFKCKLMAGNLDVRSWHSLLHCYNKITSTSIRWQPHGLPFSYGSSPTLVKRHDVRHASEIIDEIPSDGRFIILVHYYIHFTPHHDSVFSSQIRNIRKAAENLLRRNNQVKIIIRGPHTISHFHQWGPLNSGDLAGLHYIEVIKREFKGLYNKVFFVLPWGMTVALENHEFHPPGYINDNILDLVLEHACWKAG